MTVVAHKGKPGAMCWNVIRQSSTADRSRKLKTTTAMSYMRGERGKPSVIRLFVCCSNLPYDGSV